MGRLYFSYKQININNKRKEMIKLCKAVNYTTQLINIINDIEQDKSKLYQQLSDLDLVEQDLLHKVENENFNVVQGYDLAKALKDIRQARRRVKNELETFKMLSATTRTLIKPVEKANENISKRNKELNILFNNKVYNARKINTNNDIRIEIRTLISEVR